MKDCPARYTLDDDAVIVVNEAGKAVTFPCDRKPACGGTSCRWAQHLDTETKLPRWEDRAQH